MADLVIWSFIVCLMPFVMDLVLRMLSALAVLVSDGNPADFEERRPAFRQQSLNFDQPSGFIRPCP